MPLTSTESPAPAHEGTFAGSSGLALFHRVWRPAAAPRAGIVVQHGHGDHGGLYGFAVARFLDAGLAVWSIDQRGHGRSPGAQGHIDAWEDFRGGLLALRRLARTQLGAAPLFVVGHSMGGVIALDSALAAPEDLAGVVAVAPAIGTLGVPAWKVTLAHVLSRLAPRFTLGTELDLANISRDPEAVRRIAGDPLYHSRASVRLATEVMAAVERVQAEAGKLRVPVLLQHGTADRLTGIDGSQRFYANAAGDKTLLTYEGAFHNLFNDTNQAEAVADAIAWIEERL